MSDSSKAMKAWKLSGTKSQLSLNTGNFEATLRRCRRENLRGNRYYPRCLKKIISKLSFAPIIEMGDGVGELLGDLGLVALDSETEGRHRVEDTLRARRKLFAKEGAKQTRSRLLDRLGLQYNRAHDEDYRENGRIYTYTIQAYPLEVGLDNVSGDLEALNELGHHKLRWTEVETSEEEGIGRAIGNRRLRQSSQQLIQRAWTMPYRGRKNPNQTRGQTKGNKIRKRKYGSSGSISSSLTSGLESQMDTTLLGRTP